MENPTVVPETPTPQVQKSGGKSALVIIIVLLLISNIITAYFLFTTDIQEDVVDEMEQDVQIPEPIMPEQEEREMDIPELQSALVGEPVNLGDYTVTLLQIADPNEDVNLDSLDGYKYVGLEILLENNTDETVYYYTDWTLYDDEGYDYSKFARTEPVFTESGSINVNGSTRGWLNFRTIEGATNFTVKFNDTNNNYSVEFALEDLTEE